MGGRPGVVRPDDAGTGRVPLLPAFEENYHLRLNEFYRHPTPSLYAIAITAASSRGAVARAGACGPSRMRRR